LRAEENESRIISTMKIDPRLSTPLYQQVAAELRRAIADGEAKPGERMPLAKDLAAVLGVNRNTVLRALSELRDEGLLEFRRGRGITVAGTPQRGALLEKVRDLVAFARREGYATDELIDMIKAVP
jgi:GntR family transcriptional regulator